MLLDLLDPQLRILLLTARPERVHHLTEAWLRRYKIRWDLLVMRPWGDYDYARDFKQASVWDLRRYGFRPRTGDRGRPAQRRDVPLRRRPVHLHPLGVLRLTERRSGNVAVRRSVAVVYRTGHRVPTR